MTLRRILLLAALSTPLWAASFKLYLSDGTYQLVSKYEVLPDRIRFLSAERGEWEEIPQELVDIKKTEAERKDRDDALKQEAALIKAEDEAVRAQERQVRSIPQAPGVYLARDRKVESIPRAEVNVVTPKGRKILKAIAPIPVINGKSTVEVAGEASAFIVSAPKQEFYFRLESNDQFALVKVSKKKGARLVQTWNVLPVINEIEEAQDTVEIYQRQVGDDLFHAWPKQPLAPGQYAWIEYAPGKGNTQVWDFTVAP